MRLLVVGAYAHKRARSDREEKKWSKTMDVEWKMLQFLRRFRLARPPDRTSSDLIDRWAINLPRPLSSQYIISPRVSPAHHTRLISFHLHRFTIPNRETEEQSSTTASSTDVPRHHSTSSPCRYPRARPATGLELPLPPISSMSGEVSLSPTSGDPELRLKAGELH
jgi:hypothetical protein